MYDINNEGGGKERSHEGIKNEVMSFVDHNKKKKKVMDRIR